MKQLQYLPPNTSNPATYLLAGILPLKATLHKRILTTFCNMIRDMTTAEYRIIRRQLAVKTDKSKSWVITVKRLLFTYDLPSAYDLLLETPSKENWKASVKKAIYAIHEQYLKEEVKKHNSCRYINTEACSLSVRNSGEN